MDGDEWLTQYILYVQKGFVDKRKYAQWCQPTPPEIQVRNTQPGDEVLIKVFSRKSKLEPKWVWPYTVLLCSYFAVKDLGKGNWIHHSHVKRVVSSQPAGG